MKEEYEEITKEEKEIIDKVMAEYLGGPLWEHEEI